MLQVEANKMDSKENVEQVVQGKYLIEYGDKAHKDAVVEELKKRGIQVDHVMKYVNQIAVTYDSNIQSLSSVIQEIQVEGKPAVTAVHAPNKVYIVNQQGILEEKITEEK